MLIKCWSVPRGQKLPKNSIVKLGKRFFFTEDLKKSKTEENILSVSRIVAKQLKEWFFGLASTFAVIKSWNIHNVGKI